MACLRPPKTHLENVMSVDITRRSTLALLAGLAVPAIALGVRPSGYGRTTRRYFGGGGIRSKLGTSSGVVSHAARPLV